jgi:hypothetical protein
MTGLDFEGKWDQKENCYKGTALILSSVLMSNKD